MKCVFLVIGASQGGHARSASVVAEEYIRSGHEVVFVVGANSAFTPADVPTVRLARGTATPAGHLRAIPEVERLVRETGAEVVHAWDQFSGLVAFWVAVRTGARVTMTICGGRQGFSRLYLPRIAVFSDELRDGYPAGQRGRIAVIPNRISLRGFAGGLDRGAVFRQVGLDPSAFTILMVCRLGRRKIRQVERALRLFGQLREEIGGLQLLVVGANQVGDISSLEAEFAATPGAALDTTAFIREAWRLNPCADAVWGVGRSLYEAMHFGKPVFLMADDTMAGLVDEARREEFFFTNFSGRGQPDLPLETHVREHRAVVEDAAYRDGLVARNHEWLRERLDVDGIFGRYESLYRDAGPRWWARLPAVGAVFAYLVGGGLKSRYGYALARGRRT